MKYNFDSEEQALAFIETAPLMLFANSGAYLEACQSAFFQTFKERYNGLPVFARIASFKIDQFNSAVNFILQAAGHSRDRRRHHLEWPEGHHIQNMLFALLNNKLVKTLTDIDGETGFADLSEGYDDQESFSTLHITPIAPARLYEELAYLALRGSVYDKWEFSLTKTKRMTAGFVAPILENRPEDFVVYKTEDCWSGYILGYFVAYFIFDTYRGEIWILSKDDYD